MLYSAGRGCCFRRPCSRCRRHCPRECAWSILESLRTHGKRNGWLIALYVVTFCAVLPLLLHSMGDAHWQRSAYACLTAAFETTTKDDRVAAYITHNDVRVRNSLAYLETVGDGGVEQRGSAAQQSCSAAVSVAVVVPSVARNKQGKTNNYKPRYLTQVIAAYRKLLGASDTGDCVPGRLQLRFSLVVCNAEVQPASHWEARELSRYIRVIERDGGVSYDNIFEKEKLDYVFCINSTLAAHADAQWLLVAEDDAVPHNDVGAVLEELIGVRLAGRKADGVLSVKLYHPDRLLAYTRPDPRKVIELLCIGLVLGTLTWAVACGRCARLRGTADGAHRWDALCALVVYYSLMAAAVGRVNVLELRRASYQLYSLAPAPSCCTQAVLFTRHGAALSASYLNSTKCKPGRGKDSALEDLYGQTSLRALTFEPNSYAHIGVFTALRDSLVDPHDV